MTLSAISKEYGSDLALASVIAKAKKEAVEEFKAKLLDAGPPLIALELVAERGCYVTDETAEAVLIAAIEEASK